MDTHDNTETTPIPADPCAQKNAPDEEAVECLTSANAAIARGGVGTNFVANAYAGPWARKSRD